MSQRPMRVFGRSVEIIHIKAEVIETDTKDTYEPSIETEKFPLTLTDFFLLLIFSIGEHQRSFAVSPSQIKSVLARNRTWSTTSAKSRAIQHTPRTQ